MRRLRKLLLCGWLLAVATPLPAAEPIRIVHINSAGEPLASAAEELRRGLRLGFEYATAGSMRIAGRPLELREYDDRLEPQHARRLLERAALEQRADLVIGPPTSWVALALLPLAAELRLPLLVQGRADAITGSAGNPYVIRIARSVGQEAAANGAAIGGAGVCVISLAQDYPLAHEAVAAFRAALTARGGRLLHAEYLPLQEAAPAAVAADLYRRLQEHQGCDGGRYLFALWPDGRPPLAELQAADPQAYGVRLAAAGADLRQLAALTGAALEGATHYHYRLADSAVNDWFVVEHFKRFNAAPGFFAAQGFTEALAASAALRRAHAANGDSPDLAAAFRGLRFAGLTGEIYLRPDDLQALQPFLHYRLDPAAADFPRPQLLRRLGSREVPWPAGR